MATRFMPALWLALAALCPQVSWAQPAPEQTALLIGNSDYDANSQIDTASPPAGMFPDLRNPCKDVEAVEAKLILLGWSEDQIVKKCDLTKSDIAEELDKFIEKFNGMTKPLGFVYFGGHGLQVNDVAYMFGTGAKVDLQKTADTMVNKPKNELFQTSGIDIRRYLKSYIGDVYEGALVVVFDACRDNPVASVLRNNGKSVLVTAPKPSSDMLGMVINFSTTAGNFANDGLGELSPYAEALIDSMGTDVTIDETISKAAFALYHKTKNTDYEQLPSREGIFPPPPRRCFGVPCAGAAVPVAPGGGGGGGGELGPRFFVQPEALPSPVGAQKVLLDSMRAAWGPAFRPLTPMVAHATPNKKDVYKSARPMPANNLTKAIDNRILVDVFYCSGYDGTANMQLLANATAEKLRAYAAGSEGQMLIKSIRLREHPKAYNEMQGSRFIRNLIVYDELSIEEPKLAAAIQPVVGGGFAPIKNLDASAGYLKIYACQGATPDATASRIFFQTAEASVDSLARAMIKDLSAQFTGLNVAGGIQVLPTKSPASSEVRYFHQDDVALATDIASHLSQIWQIPVEAKYVGGRKVSAKTMEVWLGREVKGCTPVPNGALGATKCLNPFPPPRAMN